MNTKIIRRNVAAVLGIAGSLAIVVASLASSRASDMSLTVIDNKVDLIGRVTSAVATQEWSSVGEVTTGLMTVTLSSGRVVNIVSGTLVGASGDVGKCDPSFVTEKCVLLADMLGDAVVWFVFVKADEVAPDSTLVLPGLVDMRENGDFGVLPNGWQVPLATPVKRTCDSAPTVSLRDFINRYAGAGSSSVMSLETQAVVEVVCVAN
ncbi:MAG: hypothetical protein LW606_00675 [Ilumatobacteraceae bacterium]|nr:hypothetical protein [Ilumatobacteraceae bacterium]